MFELAAAIVVAAVALSFFSDATSRMMKILPRRTARVHTAGAKHSA
jgi:hypothetical protein